MYFYNWLVAYISALLKVFILLQCSLASFALKFWLHVCWVWITQLRKKIFVATWYSRFSSILNRLLIYHQSI
jgi:hypothetical protein